jgi:hypothetical protein
MAAYKCYVLKVSLRKRYSVKGGRKEKNIFPEKGNSMWMSNRMYTNMVAEV